MKCKIGPKSGCFNSEVALAQHCTDVESWHHTMVKIFRSELFDVKPDNYCTRIVPDINAALQDGPVTIATSIPRRKRELSFRSSSVSKKNHSQHEVIG